MGSQEANTTWQLNSGSSSSTWCGPTHSATTWLITEMQGTESQPRPAGSCPHFPWTCLSV